MLLFSCTCSANGWPVSLDMACNKALFGVACSFEFTNNANEDLYLLKRNTPLEGLYSQFVSVFLDGHPLEYEGIYAYRLPPTKDEFVLLKAGESISTTVQITDIFSIDTDGLYTVQYSRPLQYLSVNEMSAMSIDQLRESFVRGSVQLYLEDTSLLSRPEEQKVKADYTVHLQACGSASFVGDRNNNQTLTAHKKLCGGIRTARAGVGNNAVYRTWFGTYDSGRAATVKNVYQKMRDGITSKVCTYHNNGPSCKSNWYAYTRKGIQTVYLCNIYYGDPTDCSKTGESKEGTLLHEWAHAYGLIDDVAYGRTNCKNLAKRDPAGAIRNADSFLYHYCDAQ